MSTTPYPPNQDPAFDQSSRHTALKHTGAGIQTVPGGEKVFWWFARRMEGLRRQRADASGFTLIGLLIVITLPFHKRLL
jgi:hypothetical protein